MGVPASGGPEVRASGDELAVRESAGAGEGLVECHWKAVSFDAAISLFPMLQI